MSEDKKEKKKVKFALVAALAKGKKITKEGEDQAKKKIKKGGLRSLFGN